MSARRFFAARVADALLAGEWSRRQMLQRASVSIGVSGTVLRSLINAVLRRFPDAPLDARDALARFLVSRHEVTQVRRLLLGQTPAFRWFSYEPRMRPSRWPVRVLHTLSDVEQWLGLMGSDLDWLADRKGLERASRDPKLENYQYTWIQKKGGGVRLIEAPKQRLLHLQRQVLHDILDAIPPHDAAHGFRRGRSVLTHARLHTGCETVARFDLTAFFTHVPTPRAYGIFRAAGYPEQVARTLIALCTNQVPARILARAPFEARSRLAHHHLPQGAPTSPALANLAARALDARLTALARRFGANYSRYADDLVFSGDRHLCTGGAFGRAVDAIVRDEGYTVNPKKSRVMRSAQRQMVTGAVVNESVGAPRDEVDRLKAILHNCMRHGLESQARGIPRFREHLVGRVAWIEHLSPHRGARLRALLARIP